MFIRVIVGLLRWWLVATKAFRGQAAVYFTDPQIELVLIAINRLEIEMSEPGTAAMHQFTGSQIRALDRAKHALLGARKSARQARARGDDDGRA